VPYPAPMTIGVIAGLIGHAKSSAVRSGNP
jgi:hypothetical protein